MRNKNHFAQANAQRPSRKESYRFKAQTTMIMLVLVALIFGGLILFLFSFAAVVGESVEYENLYVHNMLLATLRTDTGYLKDDCKTISDLFICAFTTNTFCGTGARGRNCQGALDELMPYWIERFQEIKPGNRFLFIAESGTPAWRPIGPGGQPRRIVLGNETIEKARIRKISANQRIQKGSYILNVRLIMTKK